MKKLRYITFLIFGILLAGCTGDFDEINTDPNNLTEVGAREMPFMFAKAQSASGLNRSYYQTVQNLGADLYSQYFALTTTSFSTDRYVMTRDWQRRFWYTVYVETAPQLQSIIENATPGLGEQALANILWVYAFHRLTDNFGPLPYFGAAAQATVPYNPMDQIYDDFFKRLNQAVVDLKSLPAGTTPFKGYELMYDGDVAKWIRFANTLRLRLALRISKIDPARAKTEAEAAVAAGVLTDNADNASLLKSLNGNDTNGLSQVAEWNEFAMSSTIASYMKGYGDPRLSIYFQPDSKTGQYSSLRNGLPATALGIARNTAAYNSNAGTYWAVPKLSGGYTGMYEARFHIMCCAEAYFLRAEGTLNGWNMGGESAQKYYEDGIRASLNQWGVTASDISDFLVSTALPAAPGDNNNSPAVATTPVKWAGDVAVQRLQIGTQKWLAIFPNGMEAYAEFRRTGYPTMYPVVQSDNSDLPQGEFIKRFPYPPTEETDNAAELAKGRALLGGPDNCATRLWWDVD